MPIVRLDGCRIEPLGSYLKGLGVLRLVSRQVDRDARGWWEEDRFVLESVLDAGGLTRFFLESYLPTPVVAPWNSCSGFYAKDRKVGIKGLLGTTESRFATYRETIRRAALIPEVESGKADSPADEVSRRGAIQRACRNGLPDEAIDWLDAAVAITVEGKRGFPPILGTGGNEGHLDYTNNFMENLVKLLIQPDKKLHPEGLLLNALLGDATSGFVKAAVGQFDPGRAGGFNQGQEVETKNIPANPWNQVLTIEGAVAWASGLHRRQGVSFRQTFLSSPFTVYPSSVGYSSASKRDSELTRAEIWAPIWRQPAAYLEIETLFREGRAQLRRGPVEDGIQFARAVASLGVDRGLDAFVRFSLLKRRGDSYVALPASRFGVPDQKLKEADLLEESAHLLERCDSFLRTFRDNPPAGLDSARRSYYDAVYAFLLRRGTGRFRKVVAALGRVQREMLLRPEDSRVWLPPRLSGDWILAAGQTPEVRIAAGLSCLRGVRSNLTRGDNDFAWAAGGLLGTMSAVLARRVFRADDNTGNRYFLRSDLSVRPPEVARFLRGELDEDLIEELWFAFTLLKPTFTEGFYRDWNKQSIEEEALPASYCVLRLLFDPALEPDSGPMRSEPRVLPLLRGGRVREACQLAQRRLRMSGFPVVPAEYEDSNDGPRLSAALLIPVSGLKWAARAAGILSEEDEVEQKG